MAYLGNTPTTQNFISGTDYFNGDGSTTAFTLTRSVGSVNDVEAVINNVVQQPNSAYTISGNTITFTSAPSAGTSNIYVRYLSTTTQVITPSQNTVGLTQLTTDMQNGIGQAFKNRIINGAMMISQRGASPTITGGGDYSVDRFLNYYSGNAYTSVQSTTAPSGFKNSLLLTITTASASPTYSFFGQKIEGFNVSDLGWGTSSAQSVTLSFWVRSSVAGVYSCSLSNDNQDRSYPITYTISATNTWQQITLTIPGDTTGTWLTNNGTGIFVRWNMGTSSGSRLGTSGAWAAANYDGATGSTGANTWANTNGATFYITGVQLEKGSTATSFDYRPYGTELALCSRYYQKSFRISFYSVAPGSSQVWFAGNYPFPVQMRSSPTVTYERPNDAVTGSLDFWGGTVVTPNGGTVDSTGISFVTISTASSTANVLFGKFYANAEL